MKPRLSKLRFLCVAAWATLLLYYALFQLVAVRLQPKLLMSLDRSRMEDFLSSPLGRFREFMKPVWLNNGSIVIALFLVCSVLTMTWLLLRHRQKTIEKR